MLCVHSCACIHMNRERERYQTIFVHLSVVSILRYSWINSMSMATCIVDCHMLVALGEDGGEREGGGNCEERDVGEIVGTRDPMINRFKENPCNNQLAMSTFSLIGLWSSNGTSVCVCVCV